MANGYGATRLTTRACVAALPAPQGSCGRGCWQYRHGATGAAAEGGGSNGGGNGGPATGGGPSDPADVRCRILCKSACLAALAGRGGSGNSGARATASSRKGAKAAGALCGRWVWLNSSTASSSSKMGAGASAATVAADMAPPRRLRLRDSRPVEVGAMLAGDFNAGADNGVAGGAGATVGVAKNARSV